MNHLICKNRKGFSLLEATITVFVLGLLFTAVYRMANSTKLMMEYSTKKANMNGELNRLLRSVENTFRYRYSASAGEAPAFEVIDSDIEQCKKLIVRSRTLVDNKEVIETNTFETTCSPTEPIENENASAVFPVASVKCRGNQLASVIKTKSVPGREDTREEFFLRSAGVSSGVCFNVITDAATKSPLSISVESGVLYLSGAAVVPLRGSLKLPLSGKSDSVEYLRAGMGFGN